MATGSPTRRAIKIRARPRTVAPPLTTPPPAVAPASPTPATVPAPPVVPPEVAAPPATPSPAIVPPPATVAVAARDSTPDRGSETVTDRAPIGPFPRRPWRWRLSVVVLLAGFFVAVRAGREYLWDEGIRPTTWYESIASYGSTLWIIPVIPGIFTIIGMLLWRGPLRRMPDGVATVDTTVPFPIVCYRIVSRGTNQIALAATVEGVRARMQELPLFPYRIEVVTDNEVPLPDGDDVVAIVVPEDYETPKKAAYKARALHYAVLHSDLPPEAWVMHLDEESQPSPELVVGIHDFVATADDHPDRNIGQGIIRYDRLIERERFLTLADMIRTGDDVGRYYLQHVIGFTVFGLHGSFILVRNDVAAAVGFDFGPQGSITEDAFWALRQMGEGQRCRWVDGDLVEQSTQSVGDFVKQRRRWFAGMVKVVLYAKVQAWIRVPLAIFTLLWSTAWLSMTFTIVNLFLGLRTSSTTAFLGDLGYAAYLTTYVQGLRLNLRHHPELRWWQKAWRYVAQVVGMPLFAAMEAAGVLYAWFKPEKGFHVVQKDVTDDGEQQVSAQESAAPVPK